MEKREFGVHASDRTTLEHDERLSRVFDEVMGLGEFADSSRGSATSSRSSGQEETKGADENSGQEQHQPAGEEDSNGSRQEEKMDEGAAPSSSFPRLASPSPSPDRRSPFTVETGGGAGGASGGAAFDDALDGLPLYGAEDEEEDWHFALPMGTLEDVDVDKTARKNNNPEEGNTETPDDTFTSEPREEECEKEAEREGSNGSANTSHSSKDPSPENSQDAAALNQTAETEDSQQGERSEAAPVEDSNPPINIKDEPIDEGYDAALLPQSSIRQIKEELEHQEEELRISSVYSVGGGNNFVSPTVPAPGPPPQQATIFIPGRSAVLQAAAVAPLPLRPPVPGSLQALAPVAPPPAQPPIPGSVRCSGCSKVLLKGQTAFQRKGSTQLFCSTVCLTGHLPPAVKARTCFQCNKEITQPKDMIMIPLDNNTYMHFCGHFCLSVFRHKKKQTEKQPDKRLEKRPDKRVERKPEKPYEKQPEKPSCSVCRVTNRIEHEVTHQGRLHRLCSNACFLTWRKMRQLAMNCCEGCGLYCNSNSGSCQTLTIERSQLNFCSPTCIGTYKQTCRKLIECANCHKMVTVSSTIMERDQKGKVQLYCSSVCVEQSRPPRHILSDTPFPCCLCKVTAVPQYHLAMVDGTIRNFCSYDCVSTYRKMEHAPQPDLMNGTSTFKDPSFRDVSRPGPSVGASSVPPLSKDFSSPMSYPGHHPSHTSVPPLLPSYPTVRGQALAKAPPGQHPKPGESSANDPSKLTCHQCSTQFSTKPLLFSHQGRISMFCSKTCCEQYKTQRNILVPCEYCKLEKVHFDVISYNQQDLFFCSESCKLLFKHDLTSRNKDQPWRPCTYCSSIGQKMLHSHYGGRLEEFCRPHCMSQYTVLYYGMARCDSCRKQGYMTEKLQCLGSVRNFCTLPCLLQYCSLHFETNQRSTSNGTGSASAPLTPYAPTQPHHSSKMNPVIADVVSLASGSATQPHVTADTALTGALPTSNAHDKNLDNASTQTDAMRVPASRRRQMKNKSVLCRPFTMDQEILCQMPTESAGLSMLSFTSSEGEEKVKVVMVPVPVPVFIPVPMNMYSQHTPVPVAMTMPVPVPVVIPSRNKEVKDAAVQSEPLTEDKEELEKNKSHADQDSSYSADVASETVTPVSREDEETRREGHTAQADLLAAGCKEGSVGSAEPLMTSEAEGTIASPEPQITAQTEGSMGTSENQITAKVEGNPASSESPTATQTERSTGTSNLPSTSTEAPSSPLMDLETDFPSELLDQKLPTPQRGVKRPREGSYGRKRGRRRTGSLDRSAVVSPSTRPKLNHLYGVKAWRSWAQQRNTQPQDSHPLVLKEDILQCDSTELSFALCRFIKEVRRPNGETYSPDSIFYLCLGIQQYLFEKGRIENIFTDELYNLFATEITSMLQHWKPKLLPSGGVASSRVEEGYLWECKQLGAYSPIVLLNTLLFFCTKTFSLTTLAQHKRLSFTNLTRQSRPCSRTGKIHYLRYQRSGAVTPNQEETERLKKRQETEEGDLEMPENTTNPLHCPVRLYEFYLSRCPETVKTRTDMFYLQPEESVHTNSPYWYTCQPLEASTLQSMLTRILAVREVLQGQEAAQQQQQTSTSTASADDSSLQSRGADPGP
ncbi:zinc finger MYM-type protein 4-like isoform X2 [Myripristis murdjan]|uniref:zinc finger MYM-type protein 4-like isoform X2 n=1 Tax=Myripristis murdjan TaxID=586833 RepID=UPI0011762B2D|nr:zinc finger MYM-type protein 4-like isoform X2 [Myripristis murdjan]